MEPVKGLGIAEVLGDKREEILAIAAHHGASNVRIFGSVARGKARHDSDVDFLVEIEAGRSLLDRIGLIQDLEDLLGLDPLPRLKPVGFRTQAEIAGKACLTSPTPTDKTLPVFAIENRDDRNRIFTSRESIVQSYHAGRAKNDSVAEAATHRTPSTSHG